MLPVNIVYKKWIYKVSGLSINAYLLGSLHLASIQYAATNPPPPTTTTTILQLQYYYHYYYSPAFKSIFTVPHTYARTGIGDEQRNDFVNVDCKTSV